MIIFFSEKNIKSLATCDIYLADGTFFAAPKQFQQVYTVHGIIQDHMSFPVITVLLQSKSTQVYKEMFCKIKETALNHGVILNPNVSKAVCYD